MWKETIGLEWDKEWSSLETILRTDLILKMEQKNWITIVTLVAGKKELKIGTTINREEDQNITS